MRRRTGVAVAAVATLAVVGAVAASGAVGDSGYQVRAEQLRVPVGSEPGGAKVTLDATIYLPRGAPLGSDPTGTRSCSARTW
ncbi:MAG TPA: hypothetical protein VHN80_17185 [Kineosporiaceae bacterium]|nr:hypothetical protein [Kineosporiaceae bacterium]